VTADVGSEVDRCGRCNALLQFDTDGMGGLVPSCPKHGRIKSNGNASAAKGSSNVVDVAALPGFLKRYRESKGLNWSQLAELCGIAQPTARGLEEGSAPRSKTRSALEKALGIRIVGSGEIPVVKLEPKPRAVVAKALVRVLDPPPPVGTVVIIEPTPHRDAFLEELRAKRDRIDRLIAEIEAVA
jgi:transcriptional regulator with XRE-family HTH domain